MKTIFRFFSFPRVSFLLKKRKAQTEIINLSIMFFIVTILVVTSFMWGKPVLEKSIDRSSLQSAEQFMQSIDSKIQSIAKFGGKETLKINFGTLELKENSSDAFDDTLEFSMPTTLEISRQWLYLNTMNLEKNGTLSDSASIIRESKMDDRLRIQLIYRVRLGETGQFIDLFAEGNKISTSEIRIEKNETYRTKINGKDVSVAKVKLTFS